MSSVSSTESPVVVHCPACRRRLNVPRERFGSKGRCPGCRTTFALPPESATDEPNCETPRTRNCANSGQPQTTPPPLSELSSTAPSFTDDISEEAPSFDRSPSACATRPSGMSIRTTHWLIWALIRFGLGSGMTLFVNVFPPIGIMGAILLIWYWPARWLARHVTAAVCTTIDCPGCGFQFDAIGRWTVGGYTDHRECHILLARSRIDGSHIGHTDCPQCSSTILI